MRKYKQCEIKELVRSGYAIDITTADITNRHLDKVGYSNGVYGINGGVLEDETGQLYVITARNANLFRLF